MSRTPWIVTHDGSKPGRKAMECECLRCGERYAPALPMPVDLFVVMSQAFIKAHRACRPR